MSDTPSTVAELAVRCLEAEGVEYVFGIPGEENIRLVAAADRSPIRFILVHVIACPVDYRENLKLTNRLGELTNAL